MLLGKMSTRFSRISSSSVKRRMSRPMRQPCFMLKRPIVFQVRKSLVEYVDEELLAMNTSVFYQRIFILAKNQDPMRESQVLVALQADKKNVTLGETTMLDATVEPIESQGEGDQQKQHYTQSTTPDSGKQEKGDASPAPPEDSQVPPQVKILEPNEADQETHTRTFRFDVEEGAGEFEVEEEEEMEETDIDAEVVPEPKDMFMQFSEKLLMLQKKCMKLGYTPDPMCGLLVYMNDYTMLMLEGSEDMMGIFCRELLECVDDFWQSNRVFMIEDHITQVRHTFSVLSAITLSLFLVFFPQLYTKEFIFRRIPAAFLNEKFPPSTPNDEYLMGKQHLIIKEKMHTICRLVTISVDPTRISEIVSDMTLASTSSEMSMAEGSEEEGTLSRKSSLLLVKRSLSVMASTVFLPPDIYRKLLPEIQRIELVLASTRFYYTLKEFQDLYGKVPFGRDDDSLYWPIQNNYTPPNIFRRTPYDINLTFAEYAAEMNRR
ncbi:hypothetical protein KR222_001481, partial [Zaprionus bogoriensis]